MKGVLVIDMPPTCWDCPVCSEGYCMADVSIENKDFETSRDARCPLKEMPQEKEYREIPHSLDLDGMRKRSRDLYLHRLDVDNSYVMGWNECIEEIER